MHILAASFMLPKYLCTALSWHAHTELLLGIFKKEPTPPLCSEEGAKVFCHRAIQWFNRNCLIFLICRALTPLFGNGAGAFRIGKNSLVLIKIGKKYKVLCIEVFIVRLI